MSYTSSPFSPYLGALEIQFALCPFYTFLALSPMVLYQLESIHLDNYYFIYSQNKNRGFKEILTAFPLLYNMILMPSIKILFFSNQFQCIIPQFHKSLTNFNISYKIQHQTLTIHSLDFSNPNLIHFFLNFYQIHHDSTLNTPILPSIQENQSIRYGKHQKPTFPPLKTYLFLVFLGSSLLIPLVDDLKSLNEEKKSHLISWPYTFSSSFSFLSFLFSSFLPSPPLIQVALEILRPKYEFWLLSHNFQNCP